MIRQLKEVADKSFEKLKDYQTGKTKPIKTNREWLDEIFGGLLPGDIVTIAGQSGGGKSFELQRVKNTIMDKAVNENADNFVWCDFSWEMRYISNAIRDLSKQLNKTKKKLLTEEFTPEERELVVDYYKNLTDGRFFIEEDTITPEIFERDLVVFLEQHKDKEAVFISIDHIALAKDKGGDKKNTIDSIIEIVNRLKKSYPNTYWFVLSQLNRGILLRSAEKNINSMPNRSDVFNSDSMFFISDYLYICHNPYRLGIKQFSKVNAEAYDYLEEHFCEEKNGKASFDALGKMFYIVLKAREANVMFRDIFIEDVGVENKEKYREKEEKSSTTIEAPVFNSTSPSRLIPLEQALEKKSVLDNWGHNNSEQDEEPPF